MAELAPASAGGLRVIDLGTGMAAALASTLLADSGALVHRIAPTGDEVFDEIYPAHRGWRSATVPARPEDLHDLLARADVCLVGGEDHPAVATRRDAAALSALYPGVVVVDLTAYVAGYAAGTPAVDLLVQARTGMVAEHYSDRPLCFAVPLPTYGQALLAVLGAWAALVERSESGRGQVVTASLQQGAALFMMPFWMTAERPDAEFDKVTPKDVEHLIFRCADGTYVQFVMGVPRSVAKLYGVLGIDEPVDPADRGIPRAGAPAEMYFGNRPLIARHVARMDRADILAAAAAVGLPAGPVLEPGEFWDDPQLAANGLLVDRGGTTAAGSPIGVAGTVQVPQSRPRALPGGAPLSGVTVLDLGSYVAGPFTSRLLGDLGASVVKVEALAGDPNRGLQRHFLACQVGKRAIAVDVKSSIGTEVLARLLSRADVVTHNFRLGVAERLGCAPGAVRVRRPDAMTLHTLAFGPAGPRAADPGFDMIIQALVGLERRAGGQDGPPLWYRTPYLDYATGTLGAIAVLMAVHERRTQRRASDMWVSLLGSGMFLLSDLQRTADGALRGAPALDAARQGSHPTERLYRTDDDWVAVVVRTDETARALWDFLFPGEPALPRAAWDAAVTQRLDKQFAQWKTDELLAALDGAGVWAQRCRTDGMAELAASPAAADLLVSRVDERYGRLTGCLGPLVTFSRTRLPVGDLPGAPALGAHTRPILAELGYSAPEVEDLLRTGAVR